MYSEADELELAFRACMDNGRYDHDRWGESAMSNIYPLWMLKYLPNYPACHVGIVHDARGPNNTITLGEASSLLAFSEAASCIQRGMADVMLTGGTGTRLSLASIAFFGDGQLSHRQDDPECASRPFDADRDGQVYGEGSAVFIIEAREHAEARGATILARLLGWGASYENRRFGADSDGGGYRRAIQMALKSTGSTPEDVGRRRAHSAPPPHRRGLGGHDAVRIEGLVNDVRGHDPPVVRDGRGRLPPLRTIASAATMAS